jgi:tripartite motif-containing protein 9/67
VCKQIFTNPILLPCYHSLCLNCAVQIQSPVHQQSLPAGSLGNGHHSHASTTNFHGHSHHIVIATATVHHSQQHHNVHGNQFHNHHHHHGSAGDNSSVISSSRGDSDKSSTSSHTSSSSGGEDSSDKVSVLSETDSGVVICSSSSRPNSYASGAGQNGNGGGGGHNMHGLLFPPIQSAAFCLSCPVCHKTVYFDENGAHNLPKYRVMQTIVDKYVEARNLGTKCQLCEKNPKNATVMCEQCEIFYCDKCRESCHPLRGPLAKHSLVNPTQGKVALKQKAGPLEYKCPDHSFESLNMFCILCKVPVCIGCIQEMKHADHEVQPIQHMSKSQKVEKDNQLPLRSF